MDLEDLARRYFKHTPGVIDSNYDVVEEVDELARLTPNRAWPIIRDLILRAPSDSALAYVAAGPLEILLRGTDEELAGRIRSDAEASERIAAALRHVIIQYPSAAVRRQLSPWLCE